MGLEVSVQTAVLPSAGSPHRSMAATTMNIFPFLTGVGISDSGTQSGDNQDAFRMADASGGGSRLRALFAVADGMGGLMHGRFASAVALQLFFESFLRDTRSAAAHALRHSAAEAHFGLQQAMQKLAIPQMGTTLTAACVDGPRMSLVHIGDSRAYRIRGGRAACLTHDHSTAGELARMRILSPEKIRGHARRSELTKGLGLGLFAQPDIHRVEVREGDRIVLCTDGMWSVVEDEELAAASAASESTLEFGRTIVDLAMERGSEDNVSAIVIQLHRIPAGPAEEMPGAGGFLRRLLGRNEAAAQYSPPRRPADAPML
ncbi:MAG: serine/threonine-protein phosphatase [Anaerolineales bacterium]|nr:serine/threonine-protein phosphatase [Anaerolineales bacterium]